MHKYNTAQFSRYIVLHLHRICPLQNFLISQFSFTRKFVDMFLIYKIIKH